MTIIRKTKPTSKNVVTKALPEESFQQRSTRKTKEMQSMLKSTLWFHEKEVMPLLSPFWAWRPLSRS